MHWIDQTGTVSCRTPLSAERMADGRAVHAVEDVTCAACLKVIEIHYAPDFMGNNKPPVPTQVDWGPLFAKTLGLLLCAFLAVACQQQDPFLAARDAKPVRAEDVLQPGAIESAMTAFAEAISPTNVRGVMRFISTPSQCQMAGGVVPYVYPKWSEPRVGQELRIQWVTRACRPFVDNEPAVLMLSDRPREDGPLSGEPWGHHGCWLAVRPDFTLAPAPGTILQREGGVLELRWTPDQSVVGRTFYVQMLVATMETESRLAVSPALEVMIGSAQ